MSNHDHYIVPTWPAPRCIRACTTTRAAGSSLPPYAHNNLAHHVGDQLEHVNQNRRTLCEELNLPNPPQWLDQTHSHQCVVIEQTPHRQADAAITRTPLNVLAILTADCLPILLCDQKGQEIAAIHAGWKGLLNGVIQTTLANMHTPPETLMAWLGPRICGHCYEIGEDLYTLFLQTYPFVQAAFLPTTPQKFLLNIGKLATCILNEHHITAIYDSDQCTFEKKEHFFSYRREQQTGRMATMIWILER